MLPDYPTVIRIAHLAATLPDHAEAAALPDGDTAHAAGQMRLSLAQSLALNIGDADPIQLVAPETGVAYTQMILRAIMDSGYTTALSKVAFAERALDIALDGGIISQAQFRRFQQAEDDPSSVIEVLIAQNDVARVQLPDETTYYVLRAS